MFQCVQCLRQEDRLSLLGWAYRLSTLSDSRVWMSIMRFCEYIIKDTVKIYYPLITRVRTAPTYNQMDFSATSITVWCDGCVLPTLVRHVQHVRGSLSLSLSFFLFRIVKGLASSYFKNVKSCTIAKKSTSRALHHERACIYIKKCLFNKK